MRKYLLPEKGKFYKSNLHLHSKISDGALTPEEWKEEYMKRGYSILAYTDHDTFVPHNDLTDENFLALNGYEIGFMDKERVRAIHICAIRLTNSEDMPACQVDGRFVLEKQNKPIPNTVVGVYNYSGDKIVYDGDCVSRIFKDHVDAGFFTTYNHPEWSGEHYPEYISYNHMHAMEIVNYTSQVQGYEEYNAQIYDDMVLAGKRIYCTATDDAHGMGGAFGGFTMIKAEKLEYEAVTSALMQGHFYASQGPAIEEFYFEDGEFYIRTSPAKKIFARFLGAKVGQKARGKVAPEGEYLTELRVKPTDGAIAVRFTVIDERGMHANTNAIFLDTLL